MNEDEKPIPVPRPRQLKSSDETDATTKVYENYSVKVASVYDDLNTQLNELKTERPIPTPRARTNVSRRERDYENSPETAAPLNNQLPVADASSPSRTTGAIRKAPNIPSVKNNFDEVEAKDFDVLSQTSSTSSKSFNDSKYTTPSPGQIIKSIGSSSKMLREAIGERLGEKTSSAKHKLLKEYKNTKNVMGSWTNETKSTTSKKLKKVRNKIDSFSLNRNNAKRSFSVEDDERPQTISAGSEQMFQSLTFNSPLSNRSYNLENIPNEVSSNYEIPKSFNRHSGSDLPSYEDVVKEEKFLKRNTKLTQSLTTPKQNKLSNLENLQSDSSEESESEPPNCPAPELPEQIYGRIKKVASTDYENAPMIPLRKPPPPPNKKVEKPSNDTSDSATLCGSTSEENSLNNFAPSRKSFNNINEIADRSESWQFVDNLSLDTVESVESNEPIYANDENERVGNESMYSRMFEAKTNLLTPLQPTPVESGDRKSQSVTREILNEFDPLSCESFDNFIMKKMNHLTLLETLLSEETYGTVEEVLAVPDQEQIEEDSSVESMNRDENNEPGPAPKPPHREKKNVERQPSVIIHQNLQLKDSVEDLAEPYLAQVEENNSTSATAVVDLSRPKHPRTNWFVEGDAEKFTKNNLDKNNLNNFSSSSADKVTKTIPQLPPKVNNTSNREQYLPTYEESKNDEIVNIGMVEKITDGTSKLRSSLFNFNLKRRSSLKENKIDPKDFIPRPPFSDDSSHGGSDKSVILFKLPSGVIEDILKELNPRFVEVKKRQFKAFSDSEFKVLKEHLDLTHLTSIQYLINHKFAEYKTESGRQIFCFEINLAIPKSTPSAINPLFDSKGSPMKTQRLTYVYGIHSKNEKCLWMHRILRSLTNVFPKEYTVDFMRAGWCYMKKSISSTWSGTWLILSRRKLIFYDFTESRLEVLDLRKARCIGLKESDESTQNLFVEKGPTMLIDCPPYTCYFVMNTSRETKIWSVVIKDEAHNNGTQLRHHQLTKNNVPVFVDKCVNFIYTNGIMSEGIYRKAGSSSNIQKLITSLKKDAFSVQITRSEYNEHDVSSALKRFFRDMPEPLMGKFAVSFLSVSEMKSETDKILAYRELLNRLPTVEYQTLKKLLGHLHFIQAQRSVNKMRAENLAMVFGPTLMQPNNNENQYQIDSRDAEVVAELIMNYKKLYELSDDEIKTEQIMLAVLQKYHSAAENLSHTVKHSGDFKIWVTIDNHPEFNLKLEDKKQVNVAVTPQKTVYEVCKELETQMNLPAHQMTLMEVILKGELQRPLHYNEKVLHTILRWANWPEEDRKTNYLELRPKTKFQEQIERALKTLPSLTPCMELKFADKKTKTMKTFTLELNDTIINVLKTEKGANVKVKDFDASNCLTYLGAEKKRDSQMRWALTLVELNFAKRNRDSPFIGHIIAGNNINDQITWYTSILYSLHGYDIQPNPEIVIT